MGVRNCFRLAQGAGRLLAALALPVMASGCAYYAATGNERAMMDSHYNEVVQSLAPQEASGKPLSTGEQLVLCGSYQKLRNYEKFFSCVDQLQADIDHGDRTWNMYDISSSPHVMRANAYTELVDYGAAVREASAAVDIVNKRDLARASRIDALSALCLAQALDGARDDALKCIAELNDISTAYPFTLLVEPKMLGIARAYFALHDYQKGLEAAQQATSVWAGFSDVLTGASLTGDSMFRYNALPRNFMIAKALYETGHTAEAKADYLSLLKADGTRDNGEIYQLILYDLGRIAESEGQSTSAIDYYKQSIDIMEQQRSTINTMANKIGFVGDKQEIYARMIAAQLKQGRTELAFEYVERAKSRALVDLLASRQSFGAGATANPNVGKLLGELQSVEEQLHAEDATNTTSTIRALAQRKTEIQSELTATAPEVSALVTVSAMSGAEIQALLGPDETLVEYFQSGNALYVFLATRTSLTVKTLDGTDLSPMVQRWRGVLSDPNKQDYQTAAREGYDRLIAPVESQIKTARLVIVPHGPLHYVPFAALEDAKGTVLERWSIRYLPSASVMRYIRAKSARTGGAVLAFGNPDLGRPDLALRYAQREAEQIAALYPGSTILTGAQASKTAFRSLSPNFDYVHLATHGMFDAARPLTSGIFLAGKSLEDGELTVNEIYNLRLNADLVTLSACETGLGKVSNGDDVIGLTQGFLYAGSRSIIASLWPVDDEATLFLMTTFYEKLKSVGVEEALRQAQLAAKQKYPHPVFWAAFELTGGG